MGGVKEVMSFLSGVPSEEVVEKAKEIGRPAPVTLEAR
jgi:hypothetical protein